MAAATDFPIVGIGASAGAVEALAGFFRGVPDKPGFACVIVTHLSPDRKSMLPEIVSRYTSMKVVAMEDATPVEVDCVYLLPAAAVVGIQKPVLSLDAVDPAHPERRPVDLFFSALAEDIGELAAGVVLSGATPMAPWVSRPSRKGAV